MAYLKGKEIKQEEFKQQNKQSAEAQRQNMVNDIKKARGIKQ